MCWLERSALHCMSYDRQFYLHQICAATLVRPVPPLLVFAYFCVNFKCSKPIFGNCLEEQIVVVIPFFNTHASFVAGLILFFIDKSNQSLPLEINRSARD